MFKKVQTLIEAMTVKIKWTKDSKHGTEFFGTVNGKKLYQIHKGYNYGVPGKPSTAGNLYTVTDIETGKSLGGYVFLADAQKTAQGDFDHRSLS